MGSIQDNNNTTKENTMTTTTIDNLIAAFALAMIVVPIIMIGVADIKRHPFGK
tara:strand:- start:104 stop:262 length:159 start_codon:yes stop_codon:yes gene_type:complete